MALAGQNYYTTAFFFLMIPLNLGIPLLMWLGTQWVWANVGWWLSPLIVLGLFLVQKFVSRGKVEINSLIVTNAMTFSALYVGQWAWIHIGWWVGLLPIIAWMAAMWLDGRKSFQSDYNREDINQPINNVSIVNQMGYVGVLAMLFAYLSSFIAWIDLGWLFVLLIIGLLGFYISKGALENGTYQWREIPIVLLFSPLPLLPLFVIRWVWINYGWQVGAISLIWATALAVSYGISVRIANKMEAKLNESRSSTHTNSSEDDKTQPDEAGSGEDELEDIFAVMGGIFILSPVLLLSVSLAMWHFFGERGAIAAAVLWALAFWGYARLTTVVDAIIGLFFGASNLVIAAWVFTSVNWLAGMAIALPSLWLAAHPAINMSLNPYWREFIEKRFVKKVAEGATQPE